jgi:hypothetical protein
LIRAAFGAITEGTSLQQQEHLMAADAKTPQKDAVAAASRSDPLLSRVWREYAEMPGLRLTIKQAQRLWAMDEGVCAELLNSLVTARLLVRMSDGRYARATPARASVASKPNAPRLVGSRDRIRSA